MDIQLSPHFKLSELTVSDTAKARGIDDTPGPEHLANLRKLVVALEEVRMMLDAPMIISSGYRSPALNAAIPGSSKTSHHSLGLAADFRADRYGSPLEICRAIVRSGMRFDQLIYEQKNGVEWVHLGMGPGMRQQVMSYSPKAGYVPGLKKL